MRMKLFKMSAVDDAAYTRAETEDDAFKRLCSAFADMPRDLVQISEIADAPTEELDDEIVSRLI